MYGFKLANFESGQFDVNQLVNQAVEIAHPKYWTPLDPFNQTRHIAQLKYRDNIIFKE